jgi:hypothetical protein
MRKSLIRSPEENAQYRVKLENKRRQLIELKYKTAQIDSLDLLQADRSTLNVHQWTVISNLIHNFDIFHQEQTKQLSDLQKPNPFKTRFKLSSYEQLVTIYFDTTKPLIERIPDYYQLALRNRAIITQRTLASLVAINAMHSMNLTGYRPYFDKNLQHIYDVYYGVENVFQAERLREKLNSILNSDLTIFKLFLAILIFSSLTLDVSISIDNEYSHSQTLFHLQNHYTELLWRYILFRFRQEHMAIRFFSGMIQYCIHMQNFIHDLRKKMESAQNVMDILSKNIESSLKM